MEESVRLNIPKTMQDVRLSQWQKYIDVYEKNKDNDARDFLEKKLLEIFCDVRLSDIDRLGLGVFENTMNHLNEILNVKPQFSNKFTLKGTDGVEVEFGMIPNLDKMSYGEFIDLEKYIYSDKDLHKAMAVLFRPIKHKSKDKYIIHEYKGTGYMAEVMKDTPLNIALGARVFFYRLATKLGNYTMAYTLKELQQKNMGKEDEHSVKSGESIKQYLQSLETMLVKLEKLQDYQYISV